MKIYALVTLLEPRYQELLLGVCEALQQQFCVCGLYATTYPHFSYQVAEEYDLTQLEARVTAVARQMPPLRVRATTFGVFPVAQPIIYLSVVRTEALSRLHRRLWEATAGLAAGMVTHYHPQYWIPHITLAHGDVARENLADVLYWLQEHALDWELSIDNVALIYAEGFRQGQGFQLPLGGAHWTESLPEN